MTNGDKRLVLTCYITNVIDLDIERGTRNTSVSQVVKLSNVIDLNAVKGYNKNESIPDGKITKCD